jgi:arylsulfatase A-like enzyme/Flp pilus assembly protein TadD
VLLALALGPACNRVDFAPGPPADAPNVVLVTIDTLRADHVGAYGAKSVSTPTLDGLAREGVRFETAITATPLTLPSHATLLTGRDAPEHGVRHNGTFKLGDEALTLAERLRDAGWATGAFVGAVVLKSRFGLDQGFDVYDDEVTGEPSAAGGFIERPASEVIDAATAWLDRADRPFFLWVHLYDPHMDYRAPAEFAERFPGRPYDAEIAYADAQVDRLLSHLDESGQLERSVVVVTSDHGESLGEHGEKTHSTALYDSVLKVPFLLRGPGVPRGRLVERLVRLKDVAPTLLSLAGVAPLDTATGEDLTPLFAAAADADPAADADAERIAYSETLATMLDNGWAPLHSIRTEDWLYVRSPRPELYDVREDPHQLDNLIESEPERVKEEHARLDALVDRALENEVNGTSLDLDAETRAQLHALGYAVTDAPVIDTGIDPKDGRKYLPLLHRAMGAYAAGEFEIAEQLFVEVTKKLPASGRSHSQLASIYYQSGRYDRALNHIDWAIKFDPRSAIHHVVRAETLLALGDRARAREAYRRAAELEPDTAWSRVGMMWDALEAGDLEAADRHARHAIEEDIGESGVALRVAELWAEFQAFDHAARVLESELLRTTDPAFVHMRLAIEYARLERLELAKKHRSQAGDYATSPHLGTMYGRALAGLGEWDLAEEQLRAVLAAHPGAELAEASLERVLVWRERMAELRGS